MTTETKTTLGQGTWVCPANVSTVQVELWAAGAGGGGNNTTSDGGGGGGSAGYARFDSYSVTPGNTYTYFIGTGGPGGSGTGNGTDGGVTWWISAANYQAPGGLGGHAAFAGVDPRVGGAGGTSFTQTPLTFTATRNGASGGAGVNANTGVGGGGAGAGDTDQAANAGVAGGASAGSGGAGTTQGGGGGNGGAAGGAGNPASSAPGAGGGGAGDGGTRSGGAGSQGRLILNYIPNVTVQPSSATLTVTGYEPTALTTVSVLLPILVMSPVRIE